MMAFKDGVRLTISPHFPIMKFTMLYFKIGDKVFYPNQGLGVIENIQEEDYFGETFNIFHLRILANNSLILIPSSNAEEFGIRKPVSRKAVENAYEQMRNGLVDLTMNWKGRYKENENFMKSGLMLDMVFVLKRLYSLNLIKPLSFREKKMMEKAKELIVSELSEVSSLPTSVIEQKVLDNLSGCFKNGK